ncbi:MAG: hypothetical protein AB7F19_03215 [Candidatus Babeliales bacterium]
MNAFSTLYIVFVVTLSMHAYDFDIASFTQTILTVDKKRCVNSFVSFLEDNDGSLYVVKQYKYSTCTSLLATTITELVALDIAHTVGVPFDTAYLVPAGVYCAGKEIAMPATIHTHAPGIRFDKYKGAKYHGVSLCQKDNQGLTREIISAMALHKDLAALVAVDTLTGNNDRNNRNLFYDEQADSFMAIDMGAAFRRDLCQPSCRVINQLLDGDYINLSMQECYGLRAYAATLKNMLIHFSPASLESMIDKYAVASGIYDVSFFPERACERWRGYLGHCIKIIHISFEQAQRLLELIENLLIKIDKYFV